jgi:uncharacterized protein (DUF1697 family)
VSERSGRGWRVALLRGINLGARKRVAMADLRSIVEELGGREVQTYVQSGNVVFRSPAAASKLEQHLARAIRRRLALEIGVLVRTGAELAEVVARNPFVESSAGPKALHVTFLASVPDANRVRRLVEDDFAPDALDVEGREVYLLCPNGYGRSKLTNAFLERRLGVGATTRNWKTVTTLAELASS